MEKKDILTVLLPVLLLVTSISLAIFLKPSNVCKTDACEKQVTRLINSMDPTANPCEDFYQFACGNTLKPGNQKNVVTYIKEQKTDNFLRLYKQSIKESEHKTIRISKKLFQKCLNRDEIEQNNLRRIREVINEVWPVLDWSWLQATYKLRDLGYPFSIFLNVNIVRNYKDLNKYVLEVEKTDIRNEDSIMNKYPRDEVAKIMAKTATLVGAGNETYSLEEIEHVLDFKNLLSELYLNKYEWRQQITIERFEKEYNGIASVPFDWLEFLSKIVGKQVKLSSADYGSFLTSNNLNNWINLISTTSKKTVANYMIWKVIETHLPYLPETVRQAAKYKINETQEIFCLEECEKRFPVSPIGIAYARAALSSEKRQPVEKIFAEIKSQFLETIEKTKWIAANDKTLIKEKANSAVLVYGLPGDYSSDKMLDSLDVDFIPTKSDSLLDLLAQATRNYQTLLYRQLDVLHSDNIINRYYLRETKLSSGLLYEHLENEFYIPIEWACYLQEDVPNYGKYFHLGMLMTNFFHLLIDDFDCEGLRNIISKRTRKVGELIMKCLLEHIENQMGDEPFMVSNGLQTGIGKTFSYQAYEKWIQAHGEEEKLPGLDYTPQQLFWILSTYCHIPDTKLGSEISNMVGFYANITLISNFNNMHFAKDFKCSMESKANSLNKCQPLLVF